MMDNDAAKALDRLESDLDKLLTAIPRTAYDDFGTIAGAAKADIDYIRETLTKSAKVDGLIYALQIAKRDFKNWLTHEDARDAAIASIDTAIQRFNGEV